MTLRHENGHRKARIDHPVPLIVEALSVLVTAAGYVIAINTQARVDLAIVDGGALEATDKQETTALSGLRTIAVVEVDDASAHRAALARGVAGMITTTASIGHFRACIDAVAGGGDWHDPEIASADTGPIGPTLTKRERDVAALVAAGQRNRTIAVTLGISEGTVKMHLHNVYAKLGLESRTQLAMDARAKG